MIPTYAASGEQARAEGFEHVRTSRGSSSARLVRFFRVTAPMIEHTGGSAPALLVGS